jgi:soluble lytic murein transglycosylase-like protein
MTSRRARGVMGMGVSAAVWAAVALSPTPLAKETPAAEPPGESPLDGALSDALRDVYARLEVAAPRLAPDARRELAEVIVLEADRAQLDPLLVLAVIEVESRFDAGARSTAGAIGLMQLVEPTLRSELARHGIEGDPHDPVANVQAGVRYLRRLMDGFRRDDVALMAYNAGPGRILGYLREGEIPERFHAYPRRVNAALRRMRSTSPRATTVATAREPGRPSVAGPALQN